jgi:RimJ/RimL family protein N-acetyltransferase
MGLGGTIRGKNVTLRLPVEADLATYNDWMADMRVRRLRWVWHEPAMPATWKERFKEIAKDRQQILWSIDVDGALRGLAMGRIWSLGEGFSVHHLLIDPEHWRKGYGFDAALALHRFVFDYLDLRRSDVEAQADNLAAVRIAERLGYTEYARGHRVFYRAGSYVDQVRLVMDKETWHERWPAEREYTPLAADATR